jgi:hypothetical protein
MVFTRPQAKAACNHVLDNVLKEDDGSTLKQSPIAQGIEDIFSLYSMDVASIDSLVYDRSATETRVPIVRGAKILLRAFILYVGHARVNGNSLSNCNDCGAITQEEYDVYHLSHYVPPVSTASATILQLEVKTNVIPFCLRYYEKRISATRGIAKLSTRLERKTMWTYRYFFRM